MCLFDLCTEKRGREAVPEIFALTLLCLKLIFDIFLFIKFKRMKLLFYRLFS